MSAIGLEQVLREEAAAIHGDEKVASAVADAAAANGEIVGAAIVADGVVVAEAAIVEPAPDVPERDILYRALNRLDSVALCLSGGGIRSAVFGLGIIQALAAFPNGRGPGDSLLKQVHYLSTVSGGGYIGSWLSAWLHRAGYASVWSALTGRKRSDVEPPTLNWLRSYSNYLTPRLGLLSADTWAAVALFLRNMFLNWFVLIPPLCVVFLLVKLYAVVLAYAPRLLEASKPGSTSGQLINVTSSTLALFAIAIALIVVALRCALVNRPTCQRATNREQATATARHDDEKANRAPGVDDFGFLKRDLVWGAIAAVMLCIWINAKWSEISGWTLSQMLIIGPLAGAGAYALAWIIAWPPRSGTKRAVVQFADFMAWVAAGAVFGAAVGLGIKALSTLGPEYFFNILVLAVCAVPWIILSQLAAEMIFVGLTSTQERSDQDREWFGRSTGWYAAIAAGWFVLMFLVLAGPQLARELYGHFSQTWVKAAVSVIGPVSGIVSALIGHGDGTPAQGNAGSKTALSLNVVLALTVPIFLVFLFVGISVLLDEILLGHFLSDSKLVAGPASASASYDLRWLLFGIALAVAIAFVASRFVNINWFSLHSLYRNRLIRAFLGASHATRRPNPFTGFDQSDNPQMHELWPAKEDQAVRWQPFHVINMALNLVSSNRLAWQERKAASFTVSPLHSGSAYDADGKAYRVTREYGNPREGISLGTAMAISGAAASPNMGYNSSPLVTLLLALFNVRLGWWLGNPGKAGERSFLSFDKHKRYRAYQMEAPRMAILPFLSEMFGLTSEERPFVYLSDGGHFENLGLYEMVRRRCKFIIISDGGCDPDFAFDDLGNAVRKIAIDLGVNIKFDGLNELRSRTKEDRLDATGNSSGSSDDDVRLYAIGTIEYGSGQEGFVLYVKSAYHKDIVTNAGVRTYAAAHPDFPHETTLDQFFSESQFESYRALGFDLMSDILSRSAAAAPRLSAIMRELHEQSEQHPRS